MYNTTNVKNMHLHRDCQPGLKSRLYMVDVCQPGLKSRLKP